MGLRDIQRTFDTGKSLKTTISQDRSIFLSSTLCLFMTALHSFPEHPRPATPCQRTPPPHSYLWTCPWFALESHSSQPQLHLVVPSLQCCPFPHIVPQVFSPLVAIAGLSVLWPFFEAQREVKLRAPRAICKQCLAQAASRVNRLDKQMLKGKMEV